MLEVPRGRNLRREADHVSLERDVDENWVVLVLDRLQQLCHDRAHGLACAVEGERDPVRVRRLRDAERVCDLRGDFGDLEVQRPDHVQDDIVERRRRRLYSR